MPSFRRSAQRVQQIPEPAPVDPISGRPYGTPAPADTERDDAEFAAGQLALAGAYGPGEHLRELLKAEGWDGEGAQARVGYDPRRSAWAGTR